MKKRSYKITFGLQEGYAKNAKAHTLLFASKIISAWMEARLKAGEPLVTGLLQEGTLFFPKDRQTITISPSAIFAGELSEHADAKRTDKEVKATLESLAGTLKQKLKQESVFIIYREINWCV